MKIGPDISEDTLERLEYAFETRNAGAVYVLESWPMLYQRALAEVRGRFSEREANLILDALNGLFLTSGLAGQHLPLEIQDSITLSQLDQKWDVDPEKLMQTINGLTSFQRAAVEIWAGTHWSHFEDKDFDTGAHLAALTGDAKKTKRSRSAEV